MKNAKNSAIYEVQFLKEKLSMLKNSQNKAKKEFTEVCDAMDRTYNVQTLAQKSAELSIISSHLEYLDFETKKINLKLEILNSQLSN